MGTLYRGRRSLWLITAHAMLGSALGYAQTPPPRVIAPAQQAERDAMRLSILDAELGAESAALIRSRERLTERERAGDSLGVAEAQAAIGAHRRNIAALRRELEFVTRPAHAVRSGAAAHNMGQPPVAPCRTLAMQSPRPSWDVFQPRPGPEAAACTPGAAVHPTRGVMWLRRDVQATRLAAGAIADGRSGANAMIPRDGPPANLPAVSTRLP